MAHQAGTYVTEAVVLRLSDYGEADRIVTLLTAMKGKVSALAPGARRSRRRFGAALALFGSGEALLRERRGHELQVLEGLHSARGFPRLAQELSRFSHACYACELCRELCPPHEPEPEVFALLRTLLQYLNDLPLSDKPRTEPLRVFELRLLSAVGLKPSLEHCAACGGPVVPAPGETTVPFDLRRGGVLCQGCLFSVPGGAQCARPLPAAVHEALVLLSRTDLSTLATLGDLAVLPELLPSCRDLLLSVIQHHLGHNLRAVEFIAKLNLATP